jgi:hypothetical protein
MNYCEYDQEVIAIYYNIWTGLELHYCRNGSAWWRRQGEVVFELANPEVSFDEIENWRCHPGDGVGFVRVDLGLDCEEQETE